MRAIGMLALLAGLAGCAETDPYLKPGAWKPTGANAVNLAAMAERPTDLVRGRGARGPDRMEATTPVLRIMADRPVPLPNAGTQGSAPGPAAPAAGGTGAN